MVYIGTTIHLHDNDNTSYKYFINLCILQMVYSNYNQARQIRKKVQCKIIFYVVTSFVAIMIITTNKSIKKIYYFKMCAPHTGQVCRKCYCIISIPRLFTKKGPFICSYHWTFFFLKLLIINIQISLFQLLSFNVE